MESEFVRFSEAERVYGQKSFLHAQLGMLDMVKSFRDYKELRKKELELKVSLKARIGEAFSLLEKLENKLPKTSFKESKVSKKGRKKVLSVKEEMEELKRKLAQLQEGM